MTGTNTLHGLPRLLRAGLVLLGLCLGGRAHALIDGWMGQVDDVGKTQTFTLTARHEMISTSDGNSHYAWGYAHGTDFAMQYPGPTLIVKQGYRVNIVLNNTLPAPVSIIFPGQQGVTASGGQQDGLLTREARAVPLSENAVVAGPTYSFVAGQPGTYLYHSGTNPDLQVEMGLVGALIVRPTGYVNPTPATRADKSWAGKAYEQPGTEYERETLFLLTEMDPAVHWDVYTQVFGGSTEISVDTTAIRPSMWFINGRNAPDTLLENYVDWLPTQPYNALPRMHPGERLLMRVINAGRDLHPFHHHGNHALAIARDGRVLSSVAMPTVPDDATNAAAWAAYRAASVDATSPDFTVRSVPGQTMDLIFEWTGKGIGWDVYGHAPGDPLQPNEWAADHGKPIPVTIPSALDLSFGENWGGSPYLGLVGALPQGHPGLNTTGGYFHMWHSHNEREITTDDIFPGGMMTMLIVEPWSVNLDAE